MNGIQQKLSFKQFFALIMLYWTSRDKSVKFSFLYLIISIALVLFVVGANVFLNDWNGKFFNAIQNYDLHSILHLTLVAAILFTAFTIFSAFQDYFFGLMQIRWRNWLTAHCISRWMNSKAYYQIETFGSAIDNADQRISEDVNQIISIFSALILGILNAVLSMFFFAMILWRLSTPIRIPLLHGHSFILQGDMLWFALIYSVVNTALTFIIGRPLIRLSFLQQRFEAFFRYNLMRIRENAEQIALYKAEPYERSALQTKFNDVVSNFILILKRQRLLALFTNLVGLTANFIPTLLALPGYFARKYQMGGITQITQAFAVVNDALSFFITHYMQLAVVSATAGRLQQLLAESEQAELPKDFPYSHLITEYHRAATLILKDLSLFKPDGTLLFSNMNETFTPGQHTLIMGPSGAGKSTLLRTIAGIWPFASGTLTKPEASLWFIPQKPYLPQGSLRDAMVFPDPTVYNESHIIEALTAVGLSHLIPTLSSVENWSQKLSLGEQQRLAFARLLIHKPNWILLDEATSSLDEESETTLYHLIQTRLPQSTLISVGHRSTLTALHHRHIILNSCKARPYPRPTQIKKL